MLELELEVGVGSRFGVHEKMSFCSEPMLRASAWAVNLLYQNRCLESVHGPSACAVTAIIRTGAWSQCLDPVLVHLSELIRCLEISAQNRCLETSQRSKKLLGAVIMIGLF